MKITKILTTLLIVLTMLLTLASCEQLMADAQAAIDEATAPLKESIETLEKTKTELESAKATLEAAKAELEAAKEKLEAEKATLESAKAELEAEKAELNATIAELEVQINCLEGNHVWDGESAITYEWNRGKTSCIAIFDCINCDDKGEALSLEITEQYGVYTATFAGGIPSDTTTDDTEWIVVYTEEELVSTGWSGGAVRLGCDITCVNNGLYVMEDMLLDMNGYDLTVTADGNGIVAVYSATVEIFSDKEGSELIGPLGIGANSPEARFTVSNVALVVDSDSAALEVSGYIDISEMIFDEIYVYVYSDALELIIPDGYAMYNRSDDTLIETLDEAIEKGHIFVRPIQ